MIKTRRPPRDPWLDCARGLCLALMMIFHLPSNPLKAQLFVPFGFVPVAESFVLLAGISSGIHYGWIRRAKGPGEARRSAWSRAEQIYLTHVFIFTLVWLAGRWDSSLAYRWLIMPHSMRPTSSNFWLGIPLLYQPALLDILPMYTLLLLATPWALGLIERGRAGWLAAGSVVVWLAAQYPLAAETVRVPVVTSAYFNLFAWQLVFVVGLLVGADDSRLARFVHSCRALAASLVVLATLEVLRVTGTWGPPWRWPGMDRPTLGAFRLLFFFAIVVVAAAAFRALPPRLAGPLGFLGRRSLPVYAVSVVVCYLCFGFWHYLSSAEQIAVTLALVLGLYLPAGAVALLRSRKARQA